MKYQEPEIQWQFADIWDTTILYLNYPFEPFTAHILIAGLSYYHRKFIVFYLAFSYFRVPEFRTILLMTMQKSLKYEDCGEDLFTRNNSVQGSRVQQSRSKKNVGSGSKLKGGLLLVRQKLKLESIYKCICNIQKSIHK